jgi:hypothetical protein
MGIVALLVGLPGLDLRTWLIVLFQINAGIGTLPGDPLRVFNTLDVAVLVLAAVAFLGAWSLVPSRRRVWPVISVTLPLAGIAVLIVTHLAGRSGLMGGGFVIAVFIARSTDLRRLGYLGIAANGPPLLGRSHDRGLDIPWHGRARRRRLRPVGVVCFLAALLLGSSTSHTLPGLSR